MVRLQAKHLQKSLEWLAEISKGHNWELRAQVALWVTSSSITLSIDRTISLYMQKSCEAVNTAGLQFIPTYGRPPEFSEVLHEKLSVLSQIIYFENFLFLTSGGAEPTMTARIEKEFRYKLPVRPTLSLSFVPRSYCILIASLSGALQNLSLGHAYEDYFASQRCGDHTRPLQERWQVLFLTSPIAPAVDCVLRPLETQVDIWRQPCDRLVALLNDYSQDLVSNLRRFQDLGDKSGTEMIRSCCINSFAHLAILCGFLDNIERTPQTGLDALCDSSLERLGELAQDVHMEECTRHDVLLRVGSPYQQPG